VKRVDVEAEFGKLLREVEEHLAQPQVIANEGRRDFRRQVGHEIKPLLPCPQNA
jgi:hypothetical protein